MTKAREKKLALHVERAPRTRTATSEEERSLPPDDRVSCGDCALRRGFICRALGTTIVPIGLRHRCDIFRARVGARPP